ncbi:MAG: flagellar motor switch protein FliM [Betaproteobacteria bacterium]|nr:flagellar motor switch protein FliM [Betaproteobacteria bacterium]
MVAEQFLSQDEVDALLEGVTGESQATVAEVPTGGVRSYNLANQERIVRGRMPTLEIINERFARNLRTGLFNFMRRLPEVSVGPVRVLKYSAFLRDVGVPSNINIVQLRPLRGNGLFIFDPKLVFAVIDSLFGGSGRFHTRIEGRDFTLTEQRIILRLLEVAFVEYQKAWAGVHPMNFEYVRSEMHTQFASIATPSEIVVTTSFTIELGDSGGEMFICMPYSSLEPIRDLLYTSLQGDAQEPDKRWLTMLTKQVQAAEVELTVELAHSQATVEQLFHLNVGDFIEFDLQPTIVTKVDGVPLFDAEYGVVNGHYAVKINEFLTASREDKLTGVNHA